MGAKCTETEGESPLVFTKILERYTDRRVAVFVSVLGERNRFDQTTISAIGKLESAAGYYRVMESSGSYAYFAASAVRRITEVQSSDGSVAQVRVVL